MKSICQCFISLFIMFPSVFFAKDDSTSVKVNPFNDNNIKQPHEILNIMVNSPKSYNISIDRKIGYLQLNRENPRMVIKNTFLHYQHFTDGGFALVDNTPNKDLEDMYYSFKKAISNNDTIKAHDIFKEMLEQDDKWFKSWGCAGIYYLQVGDLEMANKYLLKAIELNEIAMEEMLYLAMVKIKMKKLDDAMNIIITLYSLNRNSEETKAVLEQIIAFSNLKIIEDRFIYPIQVRKRSPNLCDVILGDTTKYQYMALANCLAYWEMEDDIQEKYSQDSINGFFIKMKECLTTYLMTLGEKLETPDSLDKKDKRLIDIIKDTLLTEMIYWEFISTKYPTVLLLLPNETRKKIEFYIRKYCFEPIK